MSSTNAIAGYGPATRRGRRPRGQLYVNRGRTSTTYAVRFRWNGERLYRTLGDSASGMTKQKALAEIERLMSALWIGAWRPEKDGPEPEPEEKADELFDSFALGWLEKQRASGGRNGDGLSESGEQDLAWCLDHLRAWFGGMCLSEISTEEVERFVHAKRTVRRGGDGPNAEQPLSGTSVRKFVRVLRAVLAVAVRWDRIPRNPAEGVRVKAPRFKGTSLDSADAIVALLDAAAEIDARQTRGNVHGRELLATLLFAGLRISEALALRWRDVDLAQGYLRVRKSKTEAGLRTVDLLPPLRDELLALKARRDPEPDALVFGTSRGNRANPSNVRNRLLLPATGRASARLGAEGKDPLPHLTLHSCRRTFASLLVATGADPLHVADQLGHTDPGLSLRVYAQTVKRRDGGLEALRALVEGSDLPEVPAEAETAELAEEPA